MTTTTAPIIRRALISVSKKEGIIAFARSLVSLGIELISTGGTYATLKEAGVPAKEVSELTQFPEMMEGRVKTLHPYIHGGLLAKRDRHHEEILAHQIPLIDLVVCNLYPFQETIQDPTCTLEKAYSQIDIGGPSMLRSAAKNYAWVGVIVDHSDYDWVLEELRTHQGALSEASRFKLSVKAFEHTAYYDSLIADHLRKQLLPTTEQLFPNTWAIPLQRIETLRYGENPHQLAALYSCGSEKVGSVATATRIQGKSLSFNNLVDADSAWMCVRQFKEPSCVIVKHTNPCGVATQAQLLKAYELAFACDPQSAYGGVIAFNGLLEKDLLGSIFEHQFVEVIIATAISEEAALLAQQKPNVRILSIGAITPLIPMLDHKRLYGGLLLQEADEVPMSPHFKTATTLHPTGAQHSDLVFAHQVCRYVKSNAIVLAHHQQTIGIGAGQTSRVFSLKIALERAEMAGIPTQGAVLASDAFFPFPDSIEVAAKAGISAILQPGGSLKDAEVIAAANQHGIAMVLSGQRHFRH